MTYNYSNFDAKIYDLVNFRGPRPGTSAPDFQVSLTDGSNTRLLDFDAQFLVLEMGSLTCPLFQGRRRSMKRLDQRYEDVSFAVLYVREAHPGDKITAHVALDDKRALAARLAGQQHEDRRILVDDLQGRVHQAYGGYPNSVFIINRHGCVVFASDWNDPRATGKALDLLRAGKPANVRSWFKPPPPQVSLRVLRSGGKGSTLDFLRSFPRLVWNNLIRRNLRLVLRRATGVMPDIRC